MDTRSDPWSFIFFAKHVALNTWLFVDASQEIKQHESMQRTSVLVHPQSRSRANEAAPHWLTDCLASYCGWTIKPFWGWKQTAVLGRRIVPAEIQLLHVKSKLKGTNQLPMSKLWAVVATLPPNATTMNLTGEMENRENTTHEAKHFGSSITLEK